MGKGKDGKKGKRPGKRIAQFFRRLTQLPAEAYERFGLWQVLPFLLLTAGAVVLIPRIDVSPYIFSIIPKSDSYYENKRELLDAFPEANFLVAFYESDNLFASETLQTVEKLTNSLDELGCIDTVLSPTNLRDVSVRNGELETRQLYRRGLSDYSQLKQSIEETPLFSTYFLSEDGSSWNIYLFLDPGFEYKEHIPKILRVLEQIDAERCSVFGHEVFTYYLGELALEELFFLGTIALLIILCIEIIISRSFFAGILLSVAAAIPVVLNIALFPILDYSISVYNIILPVFVLILATSYGIHIYRYYSHEMENGNENTGMSGTLRSIAPVVVFAGFTTLVGFLALLVTKLPVLRELGLLIILGIVFALLTALFFFPPVLAMLRKRSRRFRKRILRIRNRKRTNFITRLSELRHGKIKIIVFILLFALLSAGFLFLRSDYRLNTVFMPRTKVYSMLKSYDRVNGASEEISVVIDFEEEYGFINQDTFVGVKRAAASIGNLPYVAKVLTPIEIIEWFNGRLLGEQQPVTPKTDYAIGEALELISYEDTGLGIGSLVDADYSKVKLIVQFSVLEKNVREAEELLRDLRSTIDSAVSLELPGVRYAAFGLPVLYERTIDYLLESQFITFVFFFCFLFIFLLILFRSFRWALVTLLPTLAALVFYFGILGWFRIPVTTEVVFVIAGVMGVSTDDVLYFVLVFRKHLRDYDVDKALALSFQKTGVAIIQTTVIIFGGLSVLLFSKIYTVVTAGFLGAVALCVGTTVTCLVIPVILRYICRGKEET